MQETLVAVAVLASLWTLVCRYAPLPLRRRCRSQLAEWAARIGWRWLEQRLRLPLPTAASCADGCANCSGCGPVGRPTGAEYAVTPDALRQTIRRK